MLVSDLYQKTLVDPSTESDHLYIVSGYASAIFARRHLQDLLSQSPKTVVNLIVGMSGQRNDHLSFVQLHKEFKGRFNGFYFDGSPQVHCKVYGWFNGKSSVVGFAGSANYSQYGFFENQQRNQMSFENPELIRGLYDELLPQSLYIPDLILDVPQGHHPEVVTGDVQPGQIVWEIPDVRVRISFLDDKGFLPDTSGLNWGQRLAKSTTKDGEIRWTPREKNQTYLSLKKDSRRDGFLPPRAIRFSLVTDDGESFDCVRAQDGDKAIHTTDNNSILGRYLRKRFGVPEGDLVTKDHLLKYGRTDFTIEKLDEETFLLDLSVGMKVI